ncbi:MAG: phosphoribosylglycinamide formyltransferase [Burkholderiales bacterium]|nr:phosphoribosylglycinamide formyltransferase [Anaerolineae bacterium]
MTIKLVVFVSGSGTNLQAIIDASQQGTLDAEIALVVSNRKSAYGLVRAEQAGIPTFYFPLKPYLDAGHSRTDYDHDLAERIVNMPHDLIVLAGWMHILSDVFLARFTNRVINLHPALPGAFAGTEAIQRTFEAFQRGEVETGGCMVHYVVPEIDAGPVIVQALVPIEPNDILEAFEARMHEAEHRLIVEAISTLANVPDDSHARLDR